MDLIGERIKEKREFFGFLINDLSTQVGITISFITQIIFEKKFLYHFNLKKSVETLYLTVCDCLRKQKYDGFSHPHITE